MHAIGVDIGGTKIAAGVVDEDGEILAQTRRDTSPDDAAGIDQAIADVYRELSESFEVSSMGLAAQEESSCSRSDKARRMRTIVPGVCWGEASVKSSTGAKPARRPRETMRSPSSHSFSSL